MTIDSRLSRIVAAQPYPLLFATISGAHLYGFPSPDSDFDLRGVHVLPLEKVIGLEVRDETIQQEMIVPPDGPQPSAGSAGWEMSKAGGSRIAAEPEAPALRQAGTPDAASEGAPLEMDIVSHDVRKFFGLLLKKNGYVLEQLFSPLIVHTTPEHEELKEICRAGVITRHHSHHYFGFAETQWKLFLKESPRRVKPLLYVYRVLLTGIHLMRTGVIEANLVTLNAEFRLPYIGELVARKLAGPEMSKLEDADVAFHEGEYQRLRGVLQAAHEASGLPESPSEGARAALNDLLVRVRTRKR